MTAPSAPVKEGTICKICGNTLRCRWTDSHGVGACQTCGVPYRLLHYDSDKALVSTAPELLLKGPWVPIIQQYWEETGHNVSPGAFNMPGSTYEVATQADGDSINSWMEAHKDELPE